MTTEKEKRYEGDNFNGSTALSPYPTSRLSPVIELVDVARQIQDADLMLGAVAAGKLKLIAAQIKSLQKQAQEVLEKAQLDAELHRTECRFERRPGQIYHRYERQVGTCFFSLVAPEEWGPSPPAAYVGSYRLELDMSWTRVDLAG
ncbi:MAG: DUF2452 domain-containing protein [Myxococcales bacterium]|nr:DUF2452 domain-containing protein [Myxococcales bacterium]